LRKHLITLFFALSLVAIYFANEIQAQNRKHSKEHLARAADRVALVLTGDLADETSRNLVSEGKLTLTQYSEVLRSKPESEDHLLKYWLAVLKINGPVALETIKTESTPTSQVPTPAQVKLGDSLTGPFRNDRLTMVISGRRLPACTQDLIYNRVTPGMVVYTNAELDQRRVKCETDYQAEVIRCGTLATDALRQSCMNTATTTRTNCLNGVNALERSTTDYQAFLTESQCSCTEAISVFPWWDNKEKVKVCPDAWSLCGDKLSNCVVIDSRFSPNHQRAQDDVSFKYNSEVIRGFTEEPGRFMARVILENKSWSSTLTSSETVMNGAMEHFLLSKGSLILSNGPSTGYRPGNQSSISDSDPTRPTFRWVNKGQELAGGALTSVAFHLNTNGYRAKVNRAYEAFLCKQFIIPAGTPTTEGTEPDLTQRNPCSSCHKMIEPLGRYFWKWDKIGTNYLFDGSRSANPSQVAWPDPTILKNSDFGNYAGDNVLGFGTALANHPSFSSCAVKRAYEIVMGRMLEGKEQADWQSRLLDTYQSNGGKVWPVMLQLIESEQFIGSPR